jgi:signal transduction histidine kinase/ActR/RegA family two-component response regulator
MCYALRDLRPMETVGRACVALGRLIDWLGRALADPAESAPEAIRAAVRARQVYAIARLTPVIMAANVVNALAIVAVFALGDEPLGLVSAWAACAIGAALWFAISSIRRRKNSFPEEIGRRTTRRLLRNAALLAAIWAFPSIVLMPGSGVVVQAFLFVIAAGMTTGGVTCFYPIPRAAAAYASILGAGAVWGVAHANAALMIGGVTVAFSFLVVMSGIIARHAEIFVSEIVARAELEQKNRRIAELMAETEAESRRVARESMRRVEKAQKMEAVGQLTGGMAHDFNNILSVIRGNAELQQDIAEKDASLINEIIAATERGADVIHKLLAFSRRQALSPKPTDIAAVYQEMRPLLVRLLSERITLSARVSEDLWRAMADPTQLQAALVNLTLNARDAMPGGGEIEIAARNRTIGDAEARAFSEQVGHKVASQDYVALLVRDNGAGMDPETAARAFEPFFTTKPIGEGTGLGLSMVLGFVRQSGGFVTIRSSPRAGADITLYLPRAHGEAGLEASSPEVAHKQVDDRVLLVEDQADVRRTLASMVRGLGFDVAETGSVSEAEALISDGFDACLVISDVVLPGGASGVDLARRFAQTRPELPVILMSGYPDKTALESEGFRITLSKPFSRDALIEAIAEAVPGQAQRIAAAKRSNR